MFYLNEIILYLLLYNFDDIRIDDNIYIYIYI